MSDMEFKIKLCRASSRYQNKRSANGKQATKSISDNYTGPVLIMLLVKLLRTFYNPMNVRGSNSDLVYRFSSLFLPYSVTIELLLASSEWWRKLQCPWKK